MSVDDPRLSTERERRRYALLQAAATNLPKLVVMSRDVGSVDGDGEVYGYEVTQSVSVAEDLLEEIEKREKTEAES